MGGEGRSSCICSSVASHTRVPSVKSEQGFWGTAPCQAAVGHPVLKAGSSAVLCQLPFVPCHCGGGVGWERAILKARAAWEPGSKAFSIPVPSQIPLASLPFPAILLNARTRRARGSQGTRFSETVPGVVGLRPPCLTSLPLPCPMHWRPGLWSGLGICPTALSPWIVSQLLPSLHSLRSGAEKKRSCFGWASLVHCSSLLPYMSRREMINKAKPPALSPNQAVLGLGERQRALVFGCKGWRLYPSVPTALLPETESGVQEAAFPFPRP